jgi:hypothetical protein
MQEEGGANADLDGRTLESCFLVGAAAPATVKGSHPSGAAGIACGE